jgi:hypothetical protein
MQRNTQVKKEACQADGKLFWGHRKMELVRMMMMREMYDIHLPKDKNLALSSPLRADLSNGKLIASVFSRPSIERTCLHENSVEQTR